MQQSADTLLGYYCIVFFLFKYCQPIKTINRDSSAPLPSSRNCYNIEGRVICWRLSTRVCAATCRYFYIQASHSPTPSPPSQFVSGASPPYPFSRDPPCTCISNTYSITAAVQYSSSVHQHVLDFLLLFLGQAGRRGLRTFPGLAWVP